MAATLDGPVLQEVYKQTVALLQEYNRMAYTGSLGGLTAGAAISAFAIKEGQVLQRTGWLLAAAALLMAWAFISASGWAFLRDVLQCHAEYLEGRMWRSDLGPARKARLDGGMSLRFAALVAGLGPVAVLAGLAFRYWFHRTGSGTAETDLVLWWSAGGAAPALLYFLLGLRGLDGATRKSIGGKPSWDRLGEPGKTVGWVGLGALLALLAMVSLRWGGGTRYGWCAHCAIIVEVLFFAFLALWARTLGAVFATWHGRQFALGARDATARASVAATGFAAAASAALERAESALEEAKLAAQAAEQDAQHVPAAKAAVTAAQQAKERAETAVTSARANEHDAETEARNAARAHADAAAAAQATSDASGNEAKSAGALEQAEIAEGRANVAAQKAEANARKAEFGAADAKKARAAVASAACEQAECAAQAAQQPADDAKKLAEAKKRAAT